MILNDAKGFTVRLFLEALAELGGRAERGQVESKARSKVPPERAFRRMRSKRGRSGESDSQQNVTEGANIILQDGYRRCLDRGYVTTHASEGREVLVLNKKGLEFYPSAALPLIHHPLLHEAANRMLSSMKAMSDARRLEMGRAFGQSILLILETDQREKDDEPEWTPANNLNP